MDIKNTKFAIYSFVKLFKRKKIKEYFCPTSRNWQVCPMFVGTQVVPHLHRTHYGSPAFAWTMEAYWHSATTDAALCTPIQAHCSGLPLHIQQKPTNVFLPPCIHAIPHLLQPIEVTVQKKPHTHCFLQQICTGHQCYQLWVAWRVGWTLWCCCWTHSVQSQWLQLQKL